MPNAHPDVSITYALSTDEARRLWDWLLRSQGLSVATRHATVAAVADAALGLHAARLSSPFVTVLARGATPAVAMSLFDPRTHAEVTTIRCMRKTLHTLPLDLAAVAHAATVHFRERDALRQITNAGLTDRMVSRTTAAILDLVRDTGPMPHRDIEARLAVGATTVHAVRLALKLAWERGALTYRNTSSGWNRERRTFALTAATYPDLDMAMNRRTATVKLVEAYFNRYGPASLRDATWWSGLSRTAIVTALKHTNRPLAAVTTPWSPSTLYVYRDRLEQFHRIDAGEPLSGLNFLAHEDVAGKAYFDTRRRYLADVDERRVFNQIGEILPTVIIDGQVVGTWSWDARQRSVTYTLFRGRTTPTLRTQIKKWANNATNALKLGYTSAVHATRAVHHPDPPTSVR
jgi:DNA glycosylase AlkZ-like